MALVGAKGPLLNEAVGHARDLAKLLADGLAERPDTSAGELEELKKLRERIDALWRR